MSCISVPCARFVGVAAIVISCGLTATPACAGYIVTLDQVGPDVVAAGTGPIDLTGLTFLTTLNFEALMIPAGPWINTGATGGIEVVDIYQGTINGPTSFGSGGVTFATSSSGDRVGFLPSNFILGPLNVPHGYTSNNPLSDSATYANQTYATLGVTPGVYEWTWGTGVNQNFTLDIVAPTSSVPDSGSTWILLLLGLTAALGLKRLLRQPV